jgi:septal ring factor EnvC (AmiA/AmiB activator)
MPFMTMPYRGPACTHARRATGVLVLGLLLGSPASLIGPALAADANAGGDDPQAELEAVRERIRELGRRLDRTRMKHDTLAARLRDTELAVSRVNAELAELDAQSKAHHGRLKKLERRRRVMVENISGLRASLRRYVRAAYATGRQDRFKLLLNQENPATLSRALTYYAYFNRERSERIRALATDLRELADIKESIDRDTRRIAGLRAEKAAARQRLDGERRRRAEVIGQLAKALDTQESRLARLRQDEAKLAELVAELAKELADIPPIEDRQVSFRTLKGKLPWPSTGSVRYRFGTPRADGTLNWKGVLVNARPGTPVHAVSHGRVAYADWLRGFGLLTIIEHGEGYMSLYGHSETLFKDVGDWVEAGELIAKVGDSGGRETSGLYFEIRHRGTPVDPMRWCGQGPAAQTAALVSP